MRDAFSSDRDLARTDHPDWSLRAWLLGRVHAGPPLEVDAASVAVGTFITGTALGWPTSQGWLLLPTLGGGVAAAVAGIVWLHLGRTGRLPGWLVGSTCRTSAIVLWRSHRQARRRAEGEQRLP